MQKFQRLQPKAQCGKFQAPSRVPEVGERSPGAKMLVPGFPDLGPPLTGRRGGEGTGQESLAESWRSQGCWLRPYAAREGLALVRERNV